MIIAYLSPCSAILHVPFPTPVPLLLYLNLSILLISSRPAQTEGWRVQVLQRLQCGDCRSCGIHSSLAYRLHRQLLLQLILDPTSSIPTVANCSYIWLWIWLAQVVQGQGKRWEMTALVILRISAYRITHAGDKRQITSRERNKFCLSVNRTISCDEKRRKMWRRGGWE